MRCESEREIINQLIQEKIAKEGEIKAKKEELRTIEGKIFRALLETSTGQGYVDWVSLMADPQSCPAACFGTSE
jgi:hypothetical protein